MQHEDETVELDRTADESLSSRIARNCLLARARQISRVVTSIYDDAMRPFGIVAPQFSLLVLIAEFGPVSRSDISRRNHHERSLQPLICARRLRDPDSLQTFPLLPAQDAYGDSLGSARPNLWWFAFNQVRDLPEKLLAGRLRLEQDWLFHYFLLNEKAVDARDRAVSEHAYDSAAAIRAGNGWYQAFPQDVSDNKDYGQLQMPVLVMGGPAYKWMKMVVGQKADNISAVDIENSGHFIQEEQPELVTKTMLDFLQGARE
jgi:pimeloyl-ACP methyl ester carboxylesterase